VTERNKGTVALGSRRRKTQICPRGNSHDQFESSWIKIRDQTNKGHLMVNVIYRLSTQKEFVKKVFFLQLQEALFSPTLILMGGFQPPD